MSRHIRKGVFVVAKFSNPAGEDYDVGEVLGFDDDGTVLVEWAAAQVVYSEDPNDLELAPDPEALRRERRADA